MRHTQKPPTSGLRQPQARSSLALRKGSTVVTILIVLLVLSGIAVGTWLYFRGSGEVETEDVITKAVIRGPFEHIVLEQGQVESSSNVEIRCEVESRNPGGTEILSVIDEGSQVEEGDKLVELDSTSLEQDRVQQQIVCNTSQAVVIQAENTLRAAEIARTEYLEGTYRQEEQTIQSEIFVAQENLRRAQLAFKSSERLAARGIVTALQLEGDRFAVDKAKNELDAAETKLDVLRKYTKEKMLKQFDSDIATSQAKWESEQESYKLEQEKLEDIVAQIDNCIIYAPQAGQVVYANIVNRRGGGTEFVVEPGASVRQGQEIILLPDPSKMQVKATINESRISLVKSGMPVKISLDAVRDRELNGVVTKVNQYAEPGSWTSGNVKEYASYISIQDPPQEIRTGMNAEVRIFVEQLEDALQVPVQTLYETKGHFFCMVKDGEDWSTREVRVGSSNDSYMTIESGVDEGELVVMNPRRYAKRLEIPDLPDPVPDPSLSRESPPDATTGSNGPPDASPGSGRGGGGPNAGGPGSGGPAGGRRSAGAGPDGAAAGGGGRAGGFDPSRMFTMLDTDGDGTISAAELQAVPADRRGRIQQADQDGDGKVTREEFMNRPRPSGGGGPPG